MDSSDEAEEDEYDVDGNYIGAHGTRRKRKRMTKEEQLYGDYWDVPQRDRRNKRGKDSSFNSQYASGSKSGGVSFVKKETIVNMSTSETMVKEGIQKKPEAPSATTAAKLSQSQVPTSFGKGGTKKKQPAPEGKVLKEEEKYQKYGKGFKMLKMMGFTADQHKEIVHVVKREDGLGLGVRKEKHMHFAGQKSRDDQHDQEEEEDRIEEERKQVETKKPSNTVILGTVLFNCNYIFY